MSQVVPALLVTTWDISSDPKTFSGKSVAIPDNPAWEGVHSFQPWANRKGEKPEDEWGVILRKNRHIGKISGQLPFAFVHLATIVLRDPWNLSTTPYFRVSTLMFLCVVFHGMCKKISTLSRQTGAHYLKLLPLGTCSYWTYQLDVWRLCQLWSSSEKLPLTISWPDLHMSRGTQKTH